MVIRVGALQDSSLFSRRLGAMPMVVCAAKTTLPNTAFLKNLPIWRTTRLEYSVRPDNEFELVAPEDLYTVDSAGALCHQRSDDADALAYRRRRDRVCAVNVGDR